MESSICFVVFFCFFLKASLIVLFMLSVLLVSILSCWYVGVVKVVCHVGFVCVIIVVCVVLLNFI